mgnify:CR=1 FL=1
MKINAAPRLFFTSNIVFTFLLISIGKIAPKLLLKLFAIFVIFDILS